MSSCCTLRLKRRRAFSRDSPSCSRISAKQTHPQTRPEGPNSYYKDLTGSQVGEGENCALGDRGEHSRGRIHRTAFQIDLPLRLRLWFFVAYETEAAFQFGGKIAVLDSDMHGLARFSAEPSI